MAPASAICLSLGATAPSTGATTVPALPTPFASASSTRSFLPEPAAPRLAPSEPATALPTPSTNAAPATNACPLSFAWSAGRILPLLNRTPAACRACQSVATALPLAATTAIAGAATFVAPPIRSEASHSGQTPTRALRPSSAPRWRIRARQRISATIWTPIHPGWRRCSSSQYVEYSSSSRLASRAPRRPTRSIYSLTSP